MIWWYPGRCGRSECRLCMDISSIICSLPPGTTGGHSVIKFDFDDMDIRSCTGCVTCGYEGPCILHDDDQKIRKAVLHADMIAFATPLYYYGMSVQLKTVGEQLEDIVLIFLQVLQ